MADISAIFVRMHVAALACRDRPLCRVQSNPSRIKTGFILASSVLTAPLRSAHSI